MCDAKVPTENPRIHSFILVFWQLSFSYICIAKPRSFRRCVSITQPNETGAHRTATRSWKIQPRRFRFPKTHDERKRGQPTPSLVEQHESSFIDSRIYPRTLYARTEDPSGWLYNISRDGPAESSTQTPNDDRRIAPREMTPSLHRYLLPRIRGWDLRPSRTSRVIARDPLPSGKTRTGEARDEPTPSYPVSWSLSTLAERCVWYLGRVLRQEDSSRGLASETRACAQRERDQICLQPERIPPWGCGGRSRQRLFSRHVNVYVHEEQEFTYRWIFARRERVTHGSAVHRSHLVAVRSRSEAVTGRRQKAEADGEVRLRLVARAREAPHPG